MKKTLHALGEDELMIGPEKALLLIYVSFGAHTWAWVFTEVRG